MLHYETLALNFFCMGRMETWSGQFTKFPHEMCVSTSFPFTILYAFCDYTVEGCYRGPIFVAMFAAFVAIFTVRVEVNAVNCPLERGGAI